MQTETCIVLLLHAICWYTLLSSAKRSICIGFSGTSLKVDENTAKDRNVCISSEKPPTSKFGKAKADIPSVMNYWCYSVLQ